MDYLQDNPFSTVVDLEEGEFEIARDATWIYNPNQQDRQNMKILYVEIDNRHQLYTDAIKSTLSYEMFIKSINSFSDRNYYKKKITISEMKNELSSEVTYLRPRWYSSFQM